ncbi:hypothetical protein C9J03_03305 [Photobacterium gaetbulicola]|uniref:Beta-lactamase-related domain-containing protein n=1 Tax=Photobacterium gaetbulicola Gung47 TaxID=658445 RepID=A0A0C5WNH9_9GAMM|nr:serine hydrolase domain-containing protein [Photobacterium gaetbulicola]AJR06624.1 hypothetical protein H744_1c1606 [Photobacterium gaetbulicola Gung47]PSU13948.1 hypothetical protein C9J03_03305 [Photobacterium gaetbulicola]
MNNISRRTLLKATAIAGAGATGAIVLGGNPKTNQELLDTLFNDALTELPAASIGAAIIKGGELVWSKGYGYQDIETRTQMNADSIWQTIGSVSKLVAWTALMQLVEKQRIELHGDISRYCGVQIRNPYHPDTAITPYHLLTHSSSFSSRKLMSAPDTMADLFCKSYTTNLKQWVQENVLEAGVSYSPELVFDNYRPGDFDNIKNDPLGVLSGYSSINSVMAAYLVECVSGIPFEQYCEEEIFGRIGMDNTAWSKEILDKSLLITPYEATKSQRAPIMAVYTKAMQDKGYLSTGEVKSVDGRGYLSVQSCDYFSPFYPSALLGTTVNSFAKFLAAFLNTGKDNHSQLLKPETVNQIFTLQRKDSVTGSGIGLGWFQCSDRGPSVWGHDGGGPGILATVEIDKDKGDGFILFVNNFFVNYKKVLRLTGDIRKLIEHIDR